MPSALSLATPKVSLGETLRGRSKGLYTALLSERGRIPGDIDEMTRSASRSFLLAQLDEASQTTDPLPADVRHLSASLHEASQKVFGHYRAYLDERRAGAGRKFFVSRAHALFFVRAVAPTKLVDGAWLYGVLRRWADSRLQALVRIYLEELGEGRPEQNHVALYRELLRTNDCDPGDRLSDEHFTQGAIQLSLAHHAAEFLPEVIGFNLGYEQLPLHLLITAYELNELDIDPYYFTLHVTIDNADTGHGSKALESVLSAYPRAGDSDDFYRRVSTGFRLNMVGLDTPAAIASFDLERELFRVLAAKAAIGAHLHSDYCQIAGRTLRQWLGSPDQLPALMQAFQASGWILRGQEARHSRFWRLLQDDRAPMFGVFSAYEQQLLRDWIETGLPAPEPSQGVSAALRPRNRFRTRLEAARAGHKLSAEERYDTELADLEDRLASGGDESETMTVLSGFMSPAFHHRPAGLHATRLFAERFARRA